MGAKWSYFRCHGVGDPEVDKVRRLWAYNCTTGGRYVYMTTTEAGGSNDGQTKYVVAATAEAEGSTITSTDIHWHKVSRHQKKYIIMFQQNNSDYTVSASKDSVTASQNTRGATTFHRFNLRGPNKPYVVLKSTSGKNLYLSSDGAGIMKLESWNLPKRSPPGASKYVDPAFLFRLVKT